MYQTTYSDGASGDNSRTMAGALRNIANRYGVTADSLVTDEEGVERTLVWLDEESAENDAGQNAVAEITCTKMPWRK